jgi:tetratricopeptide (TPR) repeat protein
MIHLTSLDSQNRGNAVAELHTAVNLNPRWARAWSGLAKACYAINDLPCEQAAARKTTQLAPSNPEYSWDAAVYSVLAGDAEEATNNLKKYLGLRPERRVDAYRLLLSGFGDPHIAWQKLLDGNANVQARGEYLGLLAETGDFESAGILWKELQQSRAPVSAEATQLYVDSLLASNRPAAAEQVWSYLLKSDPALKQDTDDPGNLIYNGGFERTPLGYGLDWRYQKYPYANLNFEASSAHTGRHALELEFTVPANGQYELINQLVPVKPSSSYTLSAMIRSEGITSDSGPRLLVTDVNCSSCLSVSTPATTGTTPWHSTEVNFTTGPQTELIRLSIYRPRSHSYPEEIAGQIWFDDVSLRPQMPSGEGREHQ